MRKSLLTALDLEEKDLFPTDNAPTGNVSVFITPEDSDIASYLQKVKDEEGIMFDLSKVSSLDEIKATVAFIKTLRGEGRND